MTTRMEWVALPGPSRTTVEDMLRTALWVKRVEREIQQEVRSQPRGVPFWAHNPAMSKRPRR